MAIDFSFIDEGDRHKPAVVFLHAFPYHSAMWAPQRKALRERARFIAFDARGLGTRSTQTTAYMLEHTVDDLLSLLDQLAIEQCVLCGLSMGGYAALRAVARAPQRVRGLVLADTQAPADSDPAKLARAASLRALLRDGSAGFAQQQIQRQLSTYTLARKPALVAELQAMVVSSGVAGIAASLVAIATRTDQGPSLPEIRVPTCVIVGAEDVVTPPSAAQALAERIPGAKLHVLAKAGHLSNLEAEDEFNRALIEYLTGLG
ncbi:MAG TPA: alpha/beta fold hydrolase [Polyangiales bacterium]